MNASRTTITEVEPLAERWVRLTFADGDAESSNRDGRAVRQPDMRTLPLETL